jgi:SAM-dependent methyltransferase
MPRTAPFEEHPLRYERWFERNRFAYESELGAVKKLLPEVGNGVEIGVGSGRFAAPLGVRLGIEPSLRMAELARKRGIEVLGGVAESLPLGDSRLDFALMVTTVCFLDDIAAALAEAYRVLRSGGCLLIGLIDKHSPLGRAYQEHKDESPFYRIATFYSTDEVVSRLEKAGFKGFDFTQTIFHNLGEITGIEPVKEGYGEGSFVVVKAVK